MLSSDFLFHSTPAANGSVSPPLFSPVAVAGLVFGYVTVERGADHVVTGIVLNIFCFGLASLAFKGLFTRATEVPEIKVMPVWRIPWLSQIDFFGRALFSQTPEVYLAFALVPIFWFLLFRTQWGLRVRSTGENPAAAESAGINVWNVRLGASAIGGSDGWRCWRHARDRPARSLLRQYDRGARLYRARPSRFRRLESVAHRRRAALIFGGAEALQLRMQAIGVANPSCRIAGRSLRSYHRGHRGVCRQGDLSRSYEYALSRAARGKAARLAKLLSEKPVHARYSDCGVPALILETG